MFVPTSIPARRAQLQRQSCFRQPPKTQLLSFIAKKHQTTIPEATSILLKQVTADTMIGPEPIHPVAAPDEKIYTGEEAADYFFRKITLKTCVEDHWAIQQRQPNYDDDEWALFHTETGNTALWVQKILCYDPILRPIPKTGTGNLFLKQAWEREGGSVKLYISPTPPQLLNPSLPARQEPKVVFHFMRHGEALHNVMYRRPGYKSIHNPALTPTGLLQCLSASHKFPFLHEIDYIFASPMRRTLQTAVATFLPIIGPNKKIVALPDLREWGNKACNTGAPREELEKLVEDLDLPIDLNLVPDGWEVNTENTCIKCDCCRRSRADRVQTDLVELRRTLLEGGHWKGMNYEKADRDVHVAIVSHGAFLSDLLRMSGQRFYNADIMTGEWRDSEWDTKNWYRGGLY